VAQPFARVAEMGGLDAGYLDAAASGDPVDAVEQGDVVAEGQPEGEQTEGHLLAEEWQGHAAAAGRRIVVNDEGTASPQQMAQQRPFRPAGGEQ